MLTELQSLARASRPPSRRMLLRSIEQASDAMLRTGGIVDLQPDVPTHVISDIHGRRDYLMSALSEPVLEGMRRGELNVVCLGDALHAEMRAEARWRRAAQDLEIGRKSGAMNQEMAEGLGTIGMICLLKTTWPSQFHFLRGNHEEINGQDWMKLAPPMGEAFLTRRWMNDEYGEDVVERYANFETCMPLLARGAGFVVSHSAPGRVLTESEINRRTPGAFKALTWTNNVDWADDDPKRAAILRETLANIGAPPSSRWIVGHRHVEDGLYRTQLDGQLWQFNDEERHLVATIDPHGSIQVAQV